MAMIKDIAVKVSMKIDNALDEFIEKEVNRELSEYAIDYKVNIKRIVKCVKQTIPEKPIGDLNSCPHYRCPACNSGVKMYKDSHVFPFCRHCGKALDWSQI